MQERTTTSDQRRPPKFRAALLAWIILALGLALTLMAWRYTAVEAERQLHERFSFRAQEIVAAIELRMRAYKRVLQGGVGLFDAMERVDRDDWAAYVARLRIDEGSRGMQGIGFTVVVPPEELSRHEAHVRAQGFEDYAVHPPGERPIYTSIVYLEPLDWRNRRALGFDMFSEPVRRTAMRRAMETGDAALSGMVTLVQETEDDVQAGFLMYLPVYHGGGVPDSVEERRARLRGWVYSPFRAEDLIRGLVGAELQELRLQVFDGFGPVAERQMYDSRPHAPLPDNAPVAMMSMDIEGHTWTVRVSGEPEFAATPWWVLGGGSVLGLLLFLLVRNLAFTRARAQTLAAEMTQALRQSEQRFRVALMNSNISVYSQDRDLRYTWLFNPAAGLDARRIIGKTDYQLARPPELIALKERVVREGLTLNQELETVLLNKPHVFSLTMEPLRDDSGDIVGLTAAAVDVTSIKQVRRELTETEARFRTVFEHAALGIMLTEIAGGAVIAVNPALQAMVGYDERELQTLPPRHYVYPEDRQPIEQIVAALASSEGNAYKMQERYLRKDGRTIVGSLTVSLVRDSEGEPRYLLWMVEDITELRIAEDRLRRAYAELEERVRRRTAELQQRTEELERSNAELEQFAYVASHDLQEPLRTVSSFAQLLGRRYGNRLDAQGNEFIEHIVSGSLRMRELIQDLLVFSRLGATGSELTKRPVAMEEVCATALGNLRRSVEESGAVITQDPLPLVQGDRGELGQLLQNLLANAIKFRGEERPRIHIGVAEEGACWRFSVRDNGIGIDPMHFERIFTLFHRLHLDHEYPGTGIGLAICKKIVARHGGRIGVESKPGGGACFWFTLPRSAGVGTQGETLH